MIQRIRSGVLWACVAGLVIAAALAVAVSPWFWLLEVLFVPLVAIGIWDYTQPKHSILRNYPILGHLRFIVEDMGPELHSRRPSCRAFDRPGRRRARCRLRRSSGP